jgi:hypothetical protein
MQSLAVPPNGFTEILVNGTIRQSLVDSYSLLSADGEGDYVVPDTVKREWALLARSLHALDNSLPPLKPLTLSPQSSSSSSSSVAAEMDSTIEFMEIIKEGNDDDDVDNIFTAG